MHGAVDWPFFLCFRKCGPGLPLQRLSTTSGNSHTHTHIYIYMKWKHQAFIAFYSKQIIGYPLEKLLKLREKRN